MSINNDFDCFLKYCKKNMNGDFKDIQKLEMDKIKVNNRPLYRLYKGGNRDRYLYEKRIIWHFNKWLEKIRLKCF